MYIYIYISLPFTFTIIVCTIKNTFYIVSFFIYFLTTPASRLPKPKTHKMFILHRQRHMGVLCKFGPTRVPTRMFAYNKQKNGTTIATAHSKTLTGKNPHHLVTSQPTCQANQLTGFCATQVPTKRHLRTGHNNNIDCILQNTLLTC